MRTTIVTGVSLFLTIALLLASCAHAFELLDCSPPSLTITSRDGQKVFFNKPILYVKYNRNALAVYQYPGTLSVNLFLNDTEMAFKGRVESNVTELNGIKETLYTTEILGLANIADSQDFRKGFKDCEFFVADKRTGSFYNELPSRVDATIFQHVEQCLKQQLCPSLGAVTVEDVLRARATPRDFGPMSIWSRSLQISFPKMQPPILAENNQPKKRANLIQAVDSIIRNVAEKFKNENNGAIAIPDIKDGALTATKGTFQGLGNLLRDASVQVRASPPEDSVQSFTFSFGIPEGHVTYKDHHAFRLMPFVGSLCADVDVLLFAAEVQMDFSRPYCRPSLRAFAVTDSGKAKSYTCGRLSFLTNPVMQWFVNAWDGEIVESVAKSVEWALAVYVHDKFDCENFRQTRNGASPASRGQRDMWGGLF